MIVCAGTGAGCGLLAEFGRRVTTDNIWLGYVLPLPSPSFFFFARSLALPACRSTLSLLQERFIEQHQRETDRPRRGTRRDERRGPQLVRIMARAFALVACLVALIAQASSFMIGPGAGAAATIRAQRQGAAVSGFTGCNPVCQRDATTDRSALRMMVSRLRFQTRERLSSTTKMLSLAPNRSSTCRTHVGVGLNGELARVWRRQRCARQVMEGLSL